MAKNTTIRFKQDNFFTRLLATEILVKFCLALPFVYVCVCVMNTQETRFGFKNSQ